MGVLSQPNATQKSIAHRHPVGVAAPHPDPGQVYVKALGTIRPWVGGKPNRGIRFEPNIPGQLNHHPGVIRIGPGAHIAYVTEPRRPIRPQQGQGHKRKKATTGPAAQ